MKVSKTESFQIEVTVQEAWHLLKYLRLLAWIGPTKEHYDYDMKAEKCCIELAELLEGICKTSGLIS